MTTPYDMLVITPDGAARYDTRQAGEDTYTAVRRHIPRPAALGTMGLGRLRAFYVDDFATQEPSPLADRVISAVGYHHPSGWCGPVILTMEEADGEVPPLTPDVIATLAELTGSTPGPLPSSSTRA